LGDSSQGLGVAPKPVSMTLPLTKKGLRADFRKALAIKSDTRMKRNIPEYVKRNKTLKSTTWKEIILAIFASTLRVDMGHDGDMVSPWDSISIHQAPLNTPGPYKIYGSSVSWLTYRRRLQLFDKKGVNRISLVHCTDPGVFRSA